MVKSFNSVIGIIKHKLIDFGVLRMYNSACSMLHKIKKLQSKTLLLLSALVLVSASVFSYGLSDSAEAVSLTELRNQAKQIQDQINQNNQAISSLVAQGETLKAKIAEFDAQIVAADAQIALINNKLAQLEIELNNAQKELDRQKELLKASVIALYKKGGASGVELMVGADSFSDYFNEQTYLEKLKSGIQESTEKVIKLKQQIQLQKEEQKELLAREKEVRTGLANARKERSDLLAQTKGQEANYRKITKELQAQQSRLLSEIVARSTVLVSSSSGGGYPSKWANAPLDAYVDDWGMFTRECVSYAAWKVAASGRYMPVWGGAGRGSARYWLENARTAYRMDSTIPTGAQPRVGSVAVWVFGQYGHVAYVEAILDNNKVKISEYNVPAWTGNYSERIINAGDPDGYVYF